MTTDFTPLFQTNVPKAYRALADTAADSDMTPAECAEQLSDDIRDQLSYYRYFTLAKEFAAAGAPNYVLSHSIAAALTATRSPIISFARCPYPAFFIEVPAEYLPVPDHPNKDKTDYPKRWISVVSTPVVRAVSLHSKGIYSIAYIQAQNNVSPIGENTLDAMNFGGISGRDPTDVHKKIAFEMQLALRLASNVVAYVTGYQENVVRRSPSKPGDIRLLDVNSPRDVFIDRDFRLRVRDLVAARTLPRARGVLAHLVRGHWRSVPEDDRLIWIAPYRRGDLNIGRVVERNDRL